MHNALTTNMIQPYFKCTYYQVYFHDNEVEVLCTRKCCILGLNCLPTHFKFKVKLCIHLSNHVFLIVTRDFKDAVGPKYMHRLINHNEGL